MATLDDMEAALTRMLEAIADHDDTATVKAIMESTRDFCKQVIEECEAEDEDEE